VSNPRRLYIRPFKNNVTQRKRKRCLYYTENDSGREIGQSLTMSLTTIERKVCKNLLQEDEIDDGHHEFEVQRNCVSDDWDGND